MVADKLILSKYLQENYRLIKLLRSSAKTKIWLVEEISSRRKFLLKIIARTGLLYSLIAEIKSAALPEIYHVEESGKTTCVVEEYLHGMDLQKYLDLRGAFDEQTVCRLAIALCDCLQELHQRHIIHRDIKPANLFLTDAGELKLIDFDAARLEKPGSFADTYLIGTPGFAPPEQYGFHQTDERTDIYSLGLTLKLLLGYENYRGFLSPVLAKCTAFDPNKRFDSARSLKRAIIRHRRLHKWKNFIVATFMGVASLSGYFLLQTPASFEMPDRQFAPEEKTSTEPETLPSIAPIVEEVPAMVSDKPDEIFSADEIIVPPIVIEEIVPETAQKVEEKVLEPPPQMSRNDFANQMRNLNLSDAELDAKQDEHQRRLELNRRVREFMRQLPEDLTAQERNDARFSFYQQEKQRLNLK